MRYFSFFGSLWLALTLISGHAQAQNDPGTTTAQAADTPAEPLYDIEVLIFRHAGPLTLPPQEAQDYSGYAVPQAHPTQDPDTAKQPSPGMETAWRKFSNSGAYQPLLFQRWRQPVSAYRNPLRYRLHDEQMLWRPQQAETELESDPIADTAAVDAWNELAADGESVTKADSDPNYYQLDGWLSFSRQRFFHIALELEQRSIDPWVEEGLSPVRSDDRIAQNRRIELDRFEYFDTPGLSVLVRITPVPEEELTSPAENHSWDAPDRSWAVPDSEG
ncbi:MAG: hypothetical protein Tsb002_00040 [Wenzhouxiangellaceae bacterium]